MQQQQYQQNHPILVKRMKYGEQRRKRRIFFFNQSMHDTETFNSSYQNAWSTRIKCVMLKQQQQQLRIDDRNKRRQRGGGARKRQKRHERSLFHLLLKIICAQHLSLHSSRKIFPTICLCAHAHSPSAWNMCCVYSTYHRAPHCIQYSTLHTDLYTWTPEHT